MSIGFSFVHSVNQFVINDIKEKTGYVALDYQAELEKAKNTNDINVQYSLPDETIITIEEERFKCTEGLFNPKCINLECDSVDKLLYDSINKCKNDKDTLYSNIVIAGCSTLFDGFAERLEKEMKIRAPSAEKIHVISPENKGYSTWAGESIIVTLPTFRDMAININEYREVGKSIVNTKLK